MPTKKVFGATISKATIAEFFPLNSNQPDFRYFLFQHHVDIIGRHYFKCYAMGNNGKVDYTIKQVTISKSSTARSLQFSTFVPLDVRISLFEQLDTLHVPPGLEIKSIKVEPFAYKQKHVSYKVEVSINQSLTNVYKVINPSPPAARLENNWSLQILGANGEVKRNRAK